MEENHTVTIRALDPAMEPELFREAYSWRPGRKKHLQPDRMSFEEFSADDPKQIVMGLFNGRLCAVFLFREFRRGWFETHFTTRRDAPKDYILTAAHTLAEWFTGNGAGLTADIIERNTPLRRFVELIGFRKAGKFKCAETSKTYVRYVRNVNKAMMVA